MAYAASALPRFIRLLQEAALSAQSDTIAVDDAKRALRKHAKSVRLAAHQRAGEAAKSRLADIGIGFSGARPPAVVSGFLPIGQEIDPLPLMERLRAEGYQLVLPVMEGKGLPLLFRAWSPGDAMAATMWGIREPLPTAPALEPDILLGPLLAFDSAGYRLGYGGGFYDRTLARLRAMKPVISIGLAFAEQQVDAVPHLDYDERLDWVLTPTGSMKCA